MLPPPQLVSHCFFLGIYLQIYPQKPQPPADIDQLCSSHHSLSLTKNSSGERGGGFQLFSSPVLFFLPCNEGGAIFSCSWLDVRSNCFLTLWSSKSPDVPVKRNLIVATMFQQHPQQHNYQAFHGRAERSWLAYYLFPYQRQPREVAGAKRRGLHRCFS